MTAEEITRLRRMVEGHMKPDVSECYDYAHGWNDCVKLILDCVGMLRPDDSQPPAAVS